MAARVEWQSFDYATHTVLAQIIDDSGLAYRAIADPVEAIRSICDLAKTIEAEHDEDADLHENCLDLILSRLS